MRGCAVEKVNKITKLVELKGLLTSRIDNLRKEIMELLDSNTALFEPPKEQVDPVHHKILQVLDKYGYLTVRGMTRHVSSKWQKKDFLTTNVQQMVELGLLDTMVIERTKQKHYRLSKKGKALLERLDEQKGVKTQSRVVRLDQPKGLNAQSSLF
jgi:DNA-binding HxlR family transcriptional regulator